MTGRPMSRRGLLEAALLAGPAAALAGCSADAAAVWRLRLATGAPGGPYNAFGKALAAQASPRLRIMPLSTSASVDNLRRLGDGSADLALAMADAAEDAVRGRAPFSRPTAVTALARVYVNYTHLVVPAHGPVRSVRDLAGRSVGTGATGSGGQVLAGRLLVVSGLTGERAVRQRPLGLADSLRALRTGTVDALIWAGGVPTPALSDLARELPLRFLPLDEQAAALRDTYGPVYTAVTLPAGVYGLTEPVGTIGVGNYLLARPQVPREAVRAVLRVVFDQWRPLLREVTAGARLEPRFAVATGDVPLHPGAVAYYRSVYG
ncbi:TRAP transporter TAXI family solute receptor [Streptomyces griseochromogenes]|uniref:TRAP transporter TAXI family solute receptor n=2 Tax=Streptomyces griseochromogenes TaxID=68214 RepID=A0ABS4LS12_9ACTN|nr:TAXI family TRAP transporter solute-binding subunit [Streptomyces griseochromogenes]MBP2049951.1 TRAP transporter TAXI family solute receptor [Streptomyces griseochromogenes]